MSRLGRNAALDHEVQFQSQLQDHAQPIDRRRLRVARSERPATFAMAAVERVLDLREARILRSVSSILVSAF